MRDAIVDERFEALRVTRLDIGAFFVAFLGGVAAYIVLRAFNVAQLIVTLALVAVMASYSVAVAKIPRLRVRLDQAGDNAYYLGLLFTLFSMAVALREFGVTQFGADVLGAGDAGAKQIIGNFGIALGTTIAGIFLRVVLHQMRVDPADVESVARIELAEAAKHMKASLDSVSMEMGSLLNQVRQRTSDQLEHLVEEVRTTLSGYNADVSATTKTLTEAANAAHASTIAQVSEVTKHLVFVAAEAEAAFDRLRQVEAPPLTLSRRLNTVATSLERVASEADRVGLVLANAGEVSARAGDALVDAASKIVETGAAVCRMENEGSERLVAASVRLREVLEGAGVALEADRLRLSSLQEQSEGSAQAALASQGAAKLVLDNLVGITRGLTELLRRKE